MLESKDIVSQEALMAPTVLRKDFEELLVVLNKVAGSVEVVSKTLAGTASAKQVVDSVEQLTASEKEVIKIQSQLSGALSKSNEEYIEYKRLVNETNKAINEKIKYGGVDAKNVNAQNSSMNELKLALDKNRIAYAALRTEQARNSAEGKALLAIIQKQDEEHSALQANLKKSVRDSNEMKVSVKDLTKQYKEATDEMATLARTLGTQSKEFQDAALKAGQLKDEIGDIKKAADNVSGSKLENLSASFGDVFSKLTSGDFGGALESAKQFSVVSKSISFKEAGKSLGEFGNTFKTLGKAILTNPLFLMAAVIGGLIAVMYKFRDSIKPVKLILDTVGDTFDYLIQKAKDFTDWVGLTTFAIDAKRKATEEAAMAEIEAIKERYDMEVKIAEAAGKDVSDLEKKKWNEVIATATIGLNALLQANNTYREEDLDKVNQYHKAIVEANTELQIMDAKAAFERRKIQDEVNKYLLEQQRRTNLLKSKYANDSLDDQIENYMLELQNTLQFYTMKKEITENFEKGIADLHAKYAKMRKEKKDKDDADLLAAEAELASKTEELKAQAWATGQSLMDSFFENEQMTLDARKFDLESRMAAELTAAGDNADAKARIEASYAKKINDIEAEQRKVKRQQAIANKVYAAFQVGINTAIGISNALATPPPPVGIALAGVIGAIGALQLATVLAQPLPKFKDGGTTKTPFIIAGEEGVERFTTPSGDVGLTPGTASVMALPVGTKIDDHKTTMRELALSSLNQEYDVDNGNRAMLEYFSGLADRQDKATGKIVKAINKSKTNLVREGSTLYNHITDDNGNKTIIRQKAMGSW